MIFFSINGLLFVFAVLFHCPHVFYPKPTYTFDRNHNVVCLVPHYLVRLTCHDTADCTLAELIPRCACALGTCTPQRNQCLHD